MITYEYASVIFWGIVNYGVLAYGAWYVYTHTIRPTIQQEMAEHDHKLRAQEEYALQLREQQAAQEKQYVQEQNTYSMLQQHVVDWTVKVEREKKTDQAVMQQRLTQLDAKRQHQNDALNAMLAKKVICPDIIEQTIQKIRQACKDPAVGLRINNAIVETFRKSVGGE